MNKKKLEEIKKAVMDNTEPEIIVQMLDGKSGMDIDYSANISYEPTRFMDYRGESKHVLLDDSDNRIIHIYSQDHWHGDAAIVGNKQALRALKRLIDMALKEDDGVAADTVVEDSAGERYSLYVACYGDDRMYELHQPNSWYDAKWNKQSHYP